MQNTLNTRILLKHDTPENWEALTTFTPLAGELIVYDGEYPRFKIGDGQTLLQDLKFVDEPKANVENPVFSGSMDVNGDAWFAGDVYIGSTSGTNKDEGSKKLATEDYVQSYLEATILGGEW